MQADIIIPLDHVVSHNTPPVETAAAFKRSMRWAYRCLQQHRNSPEGQAIYGVVHGGIDRELRKWSARYLSRLGFDGLAIGGALGENRAEMTAMLSDLAPFLPTALPRHLLGIGDGESIRNSLPFGMDSFDSCYPTRRARHGSAIVLGPHGSGTVLYIDLRKAEHRLDFDNPLSKRCSCPTCQGHSRAYIRHLFKAKEPLAGILLTVHNLQAMADYMTELKELILADQL